MVFRCRDLGKDRSTRPAWKMFMQWMPHSPSILVSRMEKPASKDTSLNVGDPRPSCLKESPHAGSAPNGCAFGRVEIGSPTTQWFIFGKLSLALQAGKRSKPVELHATTVTGSTPELATSPSLEGANTYVRTYVRAHVRAPPPPPTPPHHHLTVIPSTSFSSRPCCKSVGEHARHLKHVNQGLPKEDVHRPPLQTPPCDPLP